MELSLIAAPILGVSCLALLLQAQEAPAPSSPPAADAPAPASRQETPADAATPAQAAAAPAPAEVPAGEGPPADPAATPADAANPALPMAPVDQPPSSRLQAQRSQLASGPPVQDDAVLLVKKACPEAAEVLLRLETGFRRVRCEAFVRLPPQFR